eukprot:COSAG06_NODE_6408_length_2945_cov_4.018974_1_plen_111_part_00
MKQTRTFYQDRLGTSIGKGDEKRAFSADTLIEEAQAQLEAEGAGPSAARRGPLGNPESQPVQESVEGLGPDLRTDTWTTLGIDGAKNASLLRCRFILKRHHFTQTGLGHT